MKANRGFEVVFKESDISGSKALKAIFKSIDSVRKEKKNEKPKK